MAQKHPLHIVQAGWDTALLEADAPSDSAERQRLYAKLLEARRPGSRLTSIVLGANKGDRVTTVASVSVEPLAGRWASVGKLPRLLARLDAERPISVIAPQSPMEEGIAALAFARRRIPVVAQVHFDMLSDAALPGGSSLRRSVGRARRSLALRLFPAYAAVRTVTPDMAARLTALGARDVRAIPVPILDLDTLFDLPLGPRPARVLFVGRLAPEKNLPLWLEVARRIAQTRPDVRFDIVGDGPARASLEALAQRLGVAGAVTFHGAKPRGALPAIYGQVSVLLLTSDHEGFGRVLVEAAAAGARVVSTRTAGALDVLEDGNTGILAAIGDAEALAHGVVRALDGDRDRDNLIAAGRRRIADRFLPLTLAGQWVDMLIEAAERHAARPPR